MFCDKFTRKSKNKISEKLYKNLFVLVSSFFSNFQADCCNINSKRYQFSLFKNSILDNLFNRLLPEKKTCTKSKISANKLLFDNSENKTNIKKNIERDIEKTKIFSNIKKEKIVFKEIEKFKRNNNNQNLNSLSIDCNKSQNIKKQ